MSRVLTIGMLMTLAVAAGFYAHDYLRSDDTNESHFSFQEQNPKDVRPIKPRQELTCKFLGYALAGEDRFGNPHAWSRQWGKVSPPDVGVRYARELEGVALRISDDGKGVFMLTATAVNYGMSNAGDPIPIISNYGQYLIASDTSDSTSVKSLVIDTKTLRGVYSFTGLGGEGIEGSTHVLECH